MVPDRGIFLVADGMGGHAAGGVASEMAGRFVARELGSSENHSYVQEQVDAGYLTPEQARSHPYSNVITRCVGANSDVMPDVYLGTVKPRDRFLLASDGLTGMLEDPQLAELMAADRMPQEQVDDLITEANRHGGLDNITAIIIRIDSVDATVGDATQVTQPGVRPR